MTTATFGPEAVQTLYELWHVDAHRSVTTDDGFDWWPGHHKVSVRWRDATPRDSYPVHRLSVKTEFVRSTEGISAADIDQLIGRLARMLPCFALVHEHGDSDGADRAHSGTNGAPDTLGFASVAYLHEGINGWMPHFFAYLTILQPILAQYQAPEWASYLQAEPAHSGPDGPGAPLTSLDEMLTVADEFYLPAGKEPSRWKGCPEFTDFVTRFGRHEHCYGTASDTGLSLETSFGSDSAIIELKTDEPHPWLGNGLLSTLRLPMPMDRTTAARLAILTNCVEAIQDAQQTLLGSWAFWSPNEFDASVYLGFSAFLPNWRYGDGAATNAAVRLLGRLQWIRESHFPNLFNEPIQAILERRLSDQDRGQ